MSRQTKKALGFLSQKNWFRESGWYLAGGTALALQTGHRKSDFDTTALLNELSHTAEWKTTMERKNTIYGELFGAKMSFIAYPFFIPLHKQAQYGLISVLQPMDIAVMKIIAVSQRGRKRDFF